MRNPIFKEQVDREEAAKEWMNVFQEKEVVNIKYCRQIKKETDFKK